MGYQDSSEQFFHEAGEQSIEGCTDPILNTTPKNPIERETREHGEKKTPQRERRPRKSAKPHATEKHADAERLSVTTPREQALTVEALEAQGFTPEEVASLMGVTVRVANSKEVRDEQAIFRRLSFQRWLVEHGRLDEYTANDFASLDAIDSVDALGAANSEQHTS